MIKTISLLFATILLILISFAVTKTWWQPADDPSEITGPATTDYQPLAIVIALLFLFLFLKNLLKRNAIK